jgi:two-component system response regulator YesN
MIVDEGGGCMSRKTNFFLTMFLAFLLMLMFPTALTTVLYHNMNAVIKEDVQNSSNAMLRQVSLMIDSRLLEVEQLAAQIAFHPKINHMFSRKEILGPLSIYQYKEIMDTLSFHFASNGFIQDRYVYFNKQDAVVTPYAKSDASDFYNIYYKYEELSESDWMKFLKNSSDQAGFLPAMNVAGKSTGGSGRLITYRRSIPIGMQGPSDGAVVVLIDAEQIRKMLSNLESANKARIFVADREGRLLVRSGEDGQLDEAGLELDKLVEGKFIEYPENIGGERLMATKYVSAETGWQYISLVPHSVMMAKVNRTEMWALSLLGICILFGLLGAYLLAKRLYSPIHNLVSSILKRDSDDRNRVTAEFSLIEETLSKSWRSEEALKVVVDQQVPLIQSNFLNRLMNGIVDTQSLNEESLRFMGLRFDSDWFAVVIINVDDFRHSKLDNAEQQWAMIRFVISNISQELLG